MIDLNLLRLLKYRENFYKTYPRVPHSAIDKQTVVILGSMAEYFGKFPDHAKVDLATFYPMFRAKHPKLDEKQAAAYGKVFRSMATDLPKDKEQAILNSMFELRLGADLAKLLTDYEEGDVANIHIELARLNDEFKKDSGLRGIDFLKDDINDLLQQEIDDSGLRWRLQCLNDSVRGLRPGDFGIIAGRPDKGKTTFLASEMTYMGPQLEDDKTIIWLNNEGPGNRIMPRLYQSTLGMTMSQMIAYSKQNNLNNAYNTCMGMPWRIRIFDIHGLDVYAVEQIIEKHNPGLVVYDMIDKIRGFSDAGRTDEVLESMYDWARELAVKYEFAGVATSQISNEGDGLQFPTLGMLKDSKTGKQGACDFQMMLGASNDPGLQNVRYIGMPKNKLRREGQPSDPRATVAYKPQIARYEDIMETTEDAEVE